jgi:hypothetical protein
MPQIYEEPISTRSDGPRDEIKVTHPAYAQISASHVTGGAYLYGSDFQHQHYVCIRIRRSELNRHLSNDWPFGQEELIEVALSESQWASFVSSMNRGMGVQCTLQHINHKQVPQIPAPRSTLKDFKAEGSEAARDALKLVTEVMTDIESSKLSQKQKDELMRKLDRIKSNTRSNLKFVLEQFGEHMEATVNKAKTEISAYANHLIVASGLAKLAGIKGTKKILGYEERKDDE